MQQGTFIAAVIIYSFLNAGPAYPRDTPDIGQEGALPQSGPSQADQVCSVPTDEYVGRKFLYFPPGDLYPPYAADPFRVGFGIQPVHVRKSRIPDASDSRVNLRAGGNLALVRSLPEDPSGFGWQASIVGGFNDQNDVRNSLDNIGWDGRYGLLLTVAEKELAFKVGLLHVSSHLGDEYIEKTGRLRISYTRQELAAGVSWFMMDHWRIYSEAGRAVSMSNQQLQEPWRAQFGLEYESYPGLWKKRIAWYAAVDSQFMQERDWRGDLSIQTGFVTRSAGRTWRLGAEWYNGRPPIGELFEYTERYLSMGIWIDI